MDQRDIQTQRIEKAKVQRKNDLRWLAQSEAGRRILTAFFRCQRIKAFSCDDRLTAYNLGKADFAGELLDDLRNADLELFQAAESFSFQEEPHA